MHEQEEAGSDLLRKVIPRSEKGREKRGNKTGGRGRREESLA